MGVDFYEKMGAMEPIYVIRHPWQITKGVLLCLLGAGIVIISFLDTRPKPGPPILIAIGIWACAWVTYFQPHLRLDKTGVTVSNWLRSTKIGWGALQDVEVRFGMRLIFGEDEGVDPETTKPFSRPGLNVVSFPGSGGLGAGAVQLTGGAKTSATTIASSGSHRVWGNLPTAHRYLDRYQEFGNPDRSLTEVKPAKWLVLEVLIACVGAASVLAGIFWINTLLPQ